MSNKLKIYQLKKADPLEMDTYITIQNHHNIITIIILKLESDFFLFYSMQASLPKIKWIER